MATTEVPWLDIVLEADDEYYEKEDVYEFSNGRTFENTDSTDSGVYSGS